MYPERFFLESLAALREKLVVWLVLPGLLVSSGALGMQALSDQQLENVSARDGLMFNLQSDAGITADQIRWVMDAGNFDGMGSSLENSLRIGKAGVSGDSFRLTPIGPGGAPTTDPLDVTLSMDAFTNPEGRAGLGIQASWERMRARVDSMSVSDDTRSFGTLALDTVGSFALIGDGGLLNASTDQAILTLNIGNVDASDPDPTNWVINDPGQLYYRMDGPGGTEMRLDNLGFLLDMQQGTVGIDADGLLVSSAPGSRTDFNLTFDIFANANSSFQTNPSIDLPLLFFGWRGGLEDLDFRLKPGGAWLADGSLTEGVTTSLGFNVADDFQFVVGEAGDDRSFLEFTDPQPLPSLLSPGRQEVRHGYKTLDAVSAGQGVGGLCYGGSNAPGPLAGCSAESFASLPAELISLPPADDGLALITRNLGIHAYPSKVSYRDAVDSALDIEDQGWALISTLGDLNGNLYLYPQTGGGITMDAVISAQTIGTTQQARWENGTHLMIGDTDLDMGIGLVGADVLFAARQMDIGLSLADGGLRFYSDQGVRLQLRGMFGGGDIPDMTTPVNLSYFDMNLEFDEFAFNILPDILSQEWVAFGGFFSFANLDNGFSNQTGGAHGGDDGSYLSLAEPGFDKLDVDFRLADITGDIEIPVVWNQGGKINLIPANTTGDNIPRLTIESRMNMGVSATTPSGSQGDPFLVNSIEFGDRKLGALAIPSGRISVGLTLKTQP